MLATYSLACHSHIPACQRHLLEMLFKSSVKGSDNKAYRRSEAAGKHGQCDHIRQNVPVLPVGPTQPPPEVKTKNAIASLLEGV
jgi:hypothetical protein